VLHKGKKYHSADKDIQAQKHEATFPKSESKSGLEMASPSSPAGLHTRLDLTRQ